MRRGGDRKKEAKQGKREKEGDRGSKGERAEIAELSVKVSTRKPSQDSHSATG